MIAMVEGKVAGTTERSVILLTPGGAGYEIHLTETALSALPHKGGEASFYCQTVVREDALELFGFEDLAEREIFNTLTSISGLGPRKALSILSLYGPEELTEVVMNEDLAAITRVSGIGKKTGQQILLELRFKLDKGPGAAFKPRSAKARSVFGDALAGLKNLGYGEDEAGPVLRAVLDEEADLDVAGALRLTLKKMAEKR